MIYLLTYKNNERLCRMTQRLAGLNPIIIEGNPPGEGKTRTDAIMESHLTAISEFVKSDAKFAIICEDDIYIHPNFKEKIQEVAKFMEEKKMNVILLSYLINSDVNNWGHQIYEGYYSYRDDLWGAHCYMISKEYTTSICCTGKPFSPDWTITKPESGRCFIYPPLAVEEGNVNTDHPGQQSFHRSCATFLLSRWCII